MVNLSRITIVLVEKGTTGQVVCWRNRQDTLHCKQSDVVIASNLIIVTLDKIARLLNVDIKNLLNNTEK